MKSLKIIDSIAKSLKIPIINYNTDLISNTNKNINYFTDWGHMNHTGAKIFSNELAKEIKALTHNKIRIP
jgi:lysophospholipase L1-like esterase